jgi:phospholipase/lecithinase/hemolysin
MRSRSHAPFLWALTLVVGIVAAPATHAIAFNSLYFFGDSLTDDGSPIANAFAVNPPYSGHSFSNGATWATVAAQKLGKSATWGVNNFAVGGAVSADLNAASSVSQQAIGISQTGQYLASRGGAADAAGLHTIWMGGNDFRDYLANPGALLPDAFIAGVLGNVAAGVQSLAAAGAETFMLMGLPDISVSPDVPGFAKGAVASLVNAFNAGLGVLAGNLGGVLGVDIYTFSVIDTLAPHMGQWLDANGNPGVDPGESALPCLAVLACAAGAPDGDTSAFLLFDTIHPTKEVHALLGRAFAAAVPEPASAILLALGCALWARRRAA